MDLKRVSSAVLGLPMVIIVLLLGNKYVIDLALAIVAVIALHEYFNAFSKIKNGIKSNQMMDILSYVYEFLHKKIYEHLIPYNFLKFYCLKSKALAMSW